MAKQDVSPLIGPLVSLIAWSLIMEVWMYSGRIPALINSKLVVTPETTIDEMNKVVPRHVLWKVDNYNHLHEQPTYFIAVIFALAYMQATDSVTVGLAWGYVGARVIHSLVQAISNPIIIRFRIFAVSSLVLLALTVRAGLLLV